MHFVTLWEMSRLYATLEMLQLKPEPLLPISLLKSDPSLSEEGIAGLIWCWEDGIQRNIPSL